MATFDGVTFSERGESGTMFPAWSAGVTITEHEIPGGAPVLQTGGRKARRLSMPIRCTTAQYTSLLGKVGVEGSLAIAYGTVTATLEGISDPVEITKTAGLWFATLDFVRGV
jgi:hypothetical protein